MIGADWVAGLPSTAGGVRVDMTRSHVDLLSERRYTQVLHVVSSRGKSTAAAAAEAICDLRLCSGDGVPGVLAVEITTPERRAPGFSQLEGHWLVPHPSRRLGVPQQQRRQGAAGQRRHP